MQLSKLGAFTAIAALTSATAAMAQATQVNVTDPTSSRKAHVEIGGRLAVQEVPPTSYYHRATLGISNGACTQIAAPPTGHALIVRQVRLNDFSGGSSIVALYANANCNIAGIVGDTAVPGVGHDTITFDPALAIPSGGALSAASGNSDSINAFVDGYTVGSNVAPVAGQAIQVSGNLRR